MALWAGSADLCCKSKILPSDNRSDVTSRALFIFKSVSCFKTHAARKMNNHYHNVRAASSVPSLWTIDQLRELGELRTLIDQLHWNRDDLARAQCSEI